MNNIIKDAVTGFKNSYSALFFSKSGLFGMIVLIASFTCFQVGLSGVLANATALVASFYFKRNIEEIKSGELTFNSTLIGFAIGAFFTPNALVYLLVPVLSLITFFLTIVLKEKLSKSYLPVFSIPFTLMLWIFLAAHFSIFNGLMEFKKTDPRYFSLLILGSPLANVDSILSKFVNYEIVIAYLKSLAFVTFNSSVLTGVIVLIGLVIYSRVAFLLSILGALVSYIVCSYLDVSINTIFGISLAGNILFTFLTIGGFLLIPSYKSILWAFFASLFNVLIYFAVFKIVEPYTLPVLFAPFCINSIIFASLFMALNRTKNMNMPLIQSTSPEANIYEAYSQKLKYDKNAGYLFTLPVMGEWLVSQGYDGIHTHIGDWSKALDFIIVDENLKPFRGAGYAKEDYYAYGKPILACSDGYIEEVVDGIEDNEIGEENLQNNWGNTVIIKHGPFLFSKVSHLLKESCRFKKGDYVKRGDIIGSCGNSGRSPYPHLHFQFQTTSLIDAPGLEYGFSFYEMKTNSNYEFLKNAIPNESEIVRNPAESVELKKAFKFAPGQKIKASMKNSGKTIEETWISAVDQFNLRYLYCEENGSYAYFNSYDAGFSFNSFFGDNKSLLYLFTLSVPKLALLDKNDYKSVEILPMSISGFGIIRIIQDILSPFIIFLKPVAQIEYIIEDSAFNSKEIKIKSNTIIQIGKFKRNKYEFLVDVIDGSITSFDIKHNHTTRKCELQNI